MERCCRLKEYLNHLNFSSGSCGEFHSCYESFHQAEQISDDEYEEAGGCPRIEKTIKWGIRANTFIGRLIRHIPDKSFPMIRCYINIHGEEVKIDSKNLETDIKVICF